MMQHWQADPFAFLGPHDGVVRTWQPGARRVLLMPVAGQGATMRETAPGLFEGTLATHDDQYRLSIEWADQVQIIDDPYRFGPQLGELDLHLFAEGSHRALAQRMGAVPWRIGGVSGTLFSVWAPNALAVATIGGFNAWDLSRHAMRRRDAGVWELFVPGVGAGEHYKFAVTGADGAVREKADPLARATELPPATASVVAALPDFTWDDSEWMAGRAERHHPGAPISIYELHAGSWKHTWHGDGRPDWDGLAAQLIPYVQDMGFTHVELMPITEHPFGGSWGYQPLSMFAPSARYGDAAGFARFVDACHRGGIGVLLDWVPAHFPADEHGLARFDGTPLYEHADVREGFHPDWKTLIYDFGRPEVQGFLIASALWWLETFHIDGLRVDAVASMLYRDYSRKPGEWIPNVHGGRENLEAIAFLKRLNTTVADACPGAIMVAEESTAWPGVTAPVQYGGLGFSYKWNMGWMNDTLRYVARDPVHRRWHHGEIGFGLVYAFSERFMLPLSHDEVVHGKGSLIDKMPGDRWQQLANLRAFLTFQYAHPGKKLLFMGGEFGQRREWNHDAELDWGLLQDPGHSGIQALVRDLNRLYVAEGALHHSDADPRGFSWLVGDDQANAVFVFLRRSFHGGAPMACAFNLTPVPRANYRIGVPHVGRWVECINSDADAYGGGNIGNSGVVHAASVAAHGHEASIELTLPPLGAIILRYEGE